MTNLTSKFITVKNLKDVFLFALPIISGQIGQMLFGIGDIFVAGHHSSLAVSSIGVGSSIFAAFLMIGIGILFCTGPLASQKKGANQEDPSLLFNIFLVCTLNSIVLTLIVYLFAENIQLIGLNSEIETYVATFLKISAFTIWPALIFQSIKEYLQALGKTYFPNALIIVFNLINIGLGFFLVFGFKPYFSGYDIVGIAISTLICRLSMALILFFYMTSVCNFKTIYNLKTIQTIYKLGLPISFTIFCEVLIFTVVTVLVGQMNLIASAAQSLVLNIASLTFMVPLGIGSATSVLVGEQFGKKSLSGIKKYSYNGVTLATLLQILFATVYFCFPVFILGFMSKDTVVINYAAQLLFWVCLFQIPDGIQVVLSCVMRGLNETKIPMILGFFSYWLLGLPIGYYFAYKLNYEASGLWMGLGLGLLCMSILLAILFNKKITKLAQLG